MKTGVKHRQLILGGGAAAGIVIFLAIIVAIQYIAIRNPMRWDLTGTGKHTLASQSAKVLDTFREKKLPIEVVAFYETKDQAAKEQLQDLLDQYRDVYSSFTYSFVDPDRDRSVALQHKIESYPTLVIKAAGKDERITTFDEETLTNALVRLLRTENKKVYVLKGHGESAISGGETESLKLAKDQIEKQNYLVEELLLMQTPEVPKDAVAVIIAGPKTDPMDNEFQALREYVKRGGSLLVFLTPFKTPKLAAFLSEYGFTFRDDIVVDRMSPVLGGDYLMPVITTYVRFPITKNFSVMSLFPETRSVRAAEKPAANVEVKELCMTSPVSWTINEQQLASGKADLDEKTGIKGPLSVMTVSMVTNPDSPTGTLAKAPQGSNARGPAGKEEDPSDEIVGGGDKDESLPKPIKARIAVFGSSLIVTNKFFALQGNPDLIMNAISWLAEDENLISIRPKSAKSQPIVLTAGESLAMLVIPVVLVPLAWIFAGLAVYLFRRRAAEA